MAKPRIRLPKDLFRKKPTRASIVVVLVVVALAVMRACETQTPATSGSLEDARARRLSDVWIETEGRVKRLLDDDTHGDRHQRILLDVGGGDTLLVVHNIDVAERVPAREGDTLVVRGEYVWNEKGGLIHWTHRDPGGRRPGGWIRLGDRTYR